MHINIVRGSVDSAAMELYKLDTFCVFVVFLSKVLVITQIDVVSGDKYIIQQIEEFTQDAKVGFPNKTPNFGEGPLAKFELILNNYKSMTKFEITRKM